MSSKKIYKQSQQNILNTDNIKKKRQIFTKTLIPNKTLVDVASHKIKNQAIELKEMPEGINFESSLWLIGKTIYFFSGSPPFLVAVNHEAIKKGIESIYNFLWTVSKPLN